MSTDTEFDQADLVTTFEDIVRKHARASYGRLLAIFLDERQLRDLCEELTERVARNSITQK